MDWKDTIKYAVNVFSFLIRGKGEMTGKQFAHAIRQYYEDSSERQKVILSEVEKHIMKINATYKGTNYYYK